MSMDLPDNLPDWIKAHIELYMTDPEAGHMWDSSALGGPGMLPTLLLTTTGARSGKPRLLPLIYGTHEGQHVIIASKGGAPRHPAWYVNLSADPHCEVQVAKERYAAKARVAEGDERQAIWDMMVAAYPPYTDYQNATDRQIPVVVLERA